MNTTNLLGKTLMALCACLLLGLNSTSLAQESAASAQRQTAADGFDIAIIDGAFSRGDATLGNLLDMLREQHPDANIIVGPEISSIWIEDLKIRTTDLGMKLEALRIASGKRFTVEDETGESLLYVLEAAPEGAPERARDQLRVEAFSLSGYFASLPKTDDEDRNKDMITRKMEELEVLVEETVEIYCEKTDRMYGGDRSRMTSLTMRFHRGANLVILIGDPQSIEVAGKVIGALPHVQRSGGGTGYRGFGGRQGAFGGAQGMSMMGGGETGASTSRRSSVPVQDSSSFGYYGGMSGGGGMGGRASTPKEEPSQVSEPPSTAPEPVSR